ASFMDVPPADDFDDKLRSECDLQNILNVVDLPGIPAWAENRIDAALISGLLANAHFRQLFAFVECGGLLSGGKFVEWLNEKLESHKISRGCTLGEMQEAKHCDLPLG